MKRKILMLVFILLLVVGGLVIVGCSQTQDSGDSGAFKGNQQSIAIIRPNTTDTAEPAGDQTS